MIQSAFKSAKTNEISQQNQMIGTIGKGVKDLALGVGFVASGGLKAVSSRLKGIGGMSTAQAMQEKIESAKINKSNQEYINADDEALDKIFTKASNMSMSEEEDLAVDTVWNILHRKNDKKMNEKLDLQMFSENSKVKDTVYHGTTENFENFDESKIKSGNVYGKGFYFSSDEKFAKKYAKENGYVKKVKLNLENPFYADNEGMDKLYNYIGSSKKDFEAYKEQEGLYGDELSVIQDYLDNKVSSDLSKVMEKMGYDGMIIDRDNKKEYVVFRAKNIRKENK